MSPSVPRSGSTLIALLVGLLLWSVSVHAQDWSPLINLQTTIGEPATAIHATTLQDGRVLVIGASPTLFGPPVQGLLTVPPGTLPASLTITQPSFTYEVPYQQSAGPFQVWSSLVCAGGTLLADGRPFYLGGTLFLRNEPDNYIILVGLSKGFTFSPGADQWSTLAATFPGTGEGGHATSWYGTAVTLPNADVLVYGGIEGLIVTTSHTGMATENRSLVRWRAATNAWDVLSTSHNTPPETWSNQYSHIFVLPAPVPAGDILLIGQAGVPVFFKTATNGWTVSRHARPGGIASPNAHASSVMLPIRTIDGDQGYHNGSVLVVGEDFVDVYDPVTDAWPVHLAMGVTRAYPSTVLLPDGKVLIVGGTNAPVDANAGRAQIYDPATATLAWAGTATAAEQRGYHTVTSLQPNGRVLVGGGLAVAPDVMGALEQTTARVFTPAFVAGPRPNLVALFNFAGQQTTTLHYGESALLVWSGATPVTSAQLVGLSAMTHSFDAHQRTVQMTWLASFLLTGTPVVLVTAPASAQIAPPGPYGLSLVTAAGVPSVSTVITLAP